MECNGIDLILASGRVLVLVSGMVSGMICIYLGYRLYGEGIKSKSTGEFSFNSIKIAITAASPGIFLALFGSYLMVTIIHKQLELHQKQYSEQAPYPSTSTEKSDSEKSFLLKTQGNANEQRRDCRCLIREIKKSLFSGSQGLTPDAAETSLTVAIETLETEIERTTSHEKVIRYRATISTLEDLRNGVVH